MTSLTASLIVAGVQSGLVVLLAADKWVHKVTGATPLEGRVKNIEDTLTKANSRFSDKMSELTIYLEQRRQAFESLAQDVASLRGEMRGRTDTPPYADDRRDRRKEPR